MVSFAISLAAFLFLAYLVIGAIFVIVQLLVELLSN